MSPAGGDSAATGAPTIGGRYEVLAELGRGGMGCVYRVRDRRSGQELALKQLHAQSEKSVDRAELVRLFEREYHALSQLSHPCIIAVYDYGGVDDGMPYYTMELLSGVSLREKGQLPWSEACRLLRDVASALALLHSRRFLHRDVTPRNIYCGIDGRAKLIDFGLMAPAGVQKTIMGTPPFVAPEAVNLQPLDGRSDLYALGATAYWALTGRHAFNARKLSELRDACRAAPSPPSALCPSVPEALSRLVLSLLSLDPNGRPSSAAEVIEQLNGIAGLENDEALAIGAAYLATPKLVGRRAPLLQVRRQLVRTLRGSGSLLLVEGEAGVGRSRFLDACVLEAKLLGFACVRADAPDGARSYGVVDTLGRQLVELHPDEALTAAGAELERLAAMLPALAVARAIGSDSTSLPPPAPQAAASERAELATEAEAQSRAATQEALRLWFLNFTRERPLLIAVDDVDQIDEPSAAMLAALGEIGQGHKLMLIVSGASERTPTAPSAYQMLASNGQRLRLRELEAQESQELVSSLFGRVPNVELLSDRLHHAALGNPRALMELAEHLVEHGVVRYDAGAWSLPQKLDAGSLPDSLEQVRAERVAALPPAARALAEVLSLSPSHVFSLEEAEALCEPGALHPALDALMTAGILSLQDRGCSFSHRAYVSVLGARLSAAARAAAHAKLAAVFERRGAAAFELAWHFEKAGAVERAIDTLAGWLEPYMRDLNRSPHVGAELPRVLSQIERAIDSSSQLARPPRERLVLRSALVAFGSYEPRAIQRHGAVLMAQLAELSGLAAYRELDSGLEPGARLAAALGAVQARYDATPESERVLAPIDAIRQLARSVAAVTRVVGSTYDRKLLELVPELQPFVPLAPQLQLLSESCRAVQDLADGNFLRACEVWRTRLEIHPGALSLCYALGLVEASIGLHAALERAERCEADPAYRIQAWRIRMIYYLVQGDWVEAEACRKIEERLRIQHGGVQELDGSHLQNFLIAYARADDLMGVKQTMDALAAMAKRFEAWEPILDRARAEYHRLRGDHAQALLAFERALSRMEPAHHAAWYTTLESQLFNLVEVDRALEARTSALLAIELCEANDSLLAKLALSRALALCEARLGDFERAVPRIDAVIAGYDRLGVTGVILAGAFETRARIALEQDDGAGFEQAVRRCAEVYDRGRSAALRAKFARLLDDGKQHGVAHGETFGEPRGTVRTTRTRTETVANTLNTALDSCRGAAERADELLKLILKHLRLEAGWLYTLQADGIELAATRGGMPPGLDELVERFVTEQGQFSEALTEVGSRHGSAREAPELVLLQGGDAYRPLLLASHFGDRHWVSGVVVIRQPADGHRLLPHDILRAVSDALIEAGDVVIRVV